MRPQRGQTPDWKDGKAYAPLLQVGRSGFAWEWLRRDQNYREAAAGAVRFSRSQRPPFVLEAEQAAAGWGLHAFEAPELDAIAARPVWRRETFRFVLEADASDEGANEDRLDLGKLSQFATLVAGSGGAEHLLLSDGSHAVRLDILSGTLGKGPALLRYRLAGLSLLEAPLLVLRQLLALWRAGKFSPALHPRERRAARWILTLRAHDALAAGAGQREIAEHLGGLAATERRWRIQAPSVRSRVQRLVREARKTAAGGYLSLLRKS